MPEQEFTEPMASRESLVKTVTQTEVEVRNLVATVRELRHSIEELVDRFDADLDSIRQRTETIAIVQANLVDMSRRIGVVEAREEKRDVEISAINWRLAFASGAVAVLSVLLHLLWK